MANDQLTLPLADEDLLRLARHRYAQADREEATVEDYLQLVDIFPAVLRRLQEKIDDTLDLTGMEADGFGGANLVHDLVAEAAE